MFNCRTKLEKLLCLKYLGKRSLANSGGSQTMKLLLVGLHETTLSVDGSSTMSYVFTRNGGGAFAFGIGAGAGAGVAPPFTVSILPVEKIITDKHQSYGLGRNQVWRY